MSQTTTIGLADENRDDHGGYRIIDQGASALRFAFVHWEQGTISGRFERLLGALFIHPDDWTRSAVRIAVDLGSATTGTPRGDARLERLKMFFPGRWAHFRSASPLSRRPGGYGVMGTLEVGAHRSVVSVEVRSSAHPCGASGGEPRAYRAAALVRWKDLGVSPGRGYPPPSSGVSLSLHGEFVRPRLR